METWGLKPKAQDDPTLIDEAIAAAIAAHEADSEAHLGVDESLQSHRASEIIDHAALSIVGDKIAEGAVTPDKISGSIVLPDFQYRCYFESLDSFIFATFNNYSEYSVNGGKVQLGDGGQPDYPAELYTYLSFIAYDASVDSMQFQVDGMFPDKTAQDVKFGWNYSQSIEGSDYVGFHWSYNDQKMYCVYSDNGDVYTFEVVGIDVELQHTYGFMLTPTSLKMFVDGVEVKEWTTNLPSLESDFMIGLGMISPDSGGVQAQFANLAVNFYKG